MTKYRIMEKDGVFYIQRQGFFGGWKFAHECMDGGVITFDSLIAAREWIKEQNRGPNWEPPPDGKIHDAE